MGKLAEIAQTSKLEGPVAVTNLKGATVTYDDEATAEAACAGMKLEHRRGAFFEVEKAAPPPPPPARKRVAARRDDDDEG